MPSLSSLSNVSLGGSPTTLGRLRSTLGWVGFLVVYVFLYAPLATITVFAFNDSTVQALPWSGFTGRWFAEMLTDGPLLAAVRFGLTVSLSVVLAAAVVGTFFAVVLNQRSGRGPQLLTAAVVLPAIVPGLILGLSLAITFRMMGILPGYWTVVVGHLTFTVPIVTLVVLTRLRRLDPTLVQASMDLGAGPWRTFWHVTLPQIRTSVFAAALLTLTLSFDEVIVTFFLVGTQQTLPLFIWAQTRFGFTPEVNAVVTVIGLVSVILIVIATRVIERQVDPYERVGHRKSSEDES